MKSTFWTKEIVGERATRMGIASGKGTFNFGDLVLKSCHVDFCPIRLEYICAFWSYAAAQSKGETAYVTPVALADGQYVFHHRGHPSVLLEFSEDAACQQAPVTNHDWTSLGWSVAQHEDWWTTLDNDGRWQRGAGAGSEPYEGGFSETSLDRLLSTLACDSGLTSFVHRWRDELLEHPLPPCKVVHGDFQLRNLSLTPSGLLIFDLETTHTGPSGFDFAQLIFDAALTSPPPILRSLCAGYVAGVASTPLSSNALRSLLVWRNLQELWIRVDRGIGVETIELELLDCVTELCVTEYASVVRC